MTDKIFEYDIVFYVACPYTGKVMIVDIINEDHGLSSPDGDTNRFEVKIPNTKSYDKYTAVVKRAKLYPGNNKIKITLDANVVFDKYAFYCANSVDDDNPDIQTKLPSASFIVNTIVGQISQIFSFTDTSTGDPTSWLWDFGDSTTSTLQNPDHRYTNNGIYTVSLITTNPVGQCLKPAIRDGFIIVTDKPNSPVVRFSAYPTTGKAPLSVSFNNETLGGVLEWTWDFGDGTTSKDQNPADHLYGKPGSYTVTLHAKNSFAVTKRSMQIGVTGDPTTVNFTSDKTSGALPLTVHFTNGGTSDNAQKSIIDYGDGKVDIVVGLLTEMTYTYLVEGVFIPTLTVVDKYGVEHKQVGATITSSIPSPTCSFTMTPTSGTIPLQVTVTNTSQVFNPQKMWMDWGEDKYEGPVITTPIVATLEKAGTYTFLLTIVDSKGQTISDTQYITTSAPAYTPPVVVDPVTPSTEEGGSSGGVPGGYKYHLRIDGFRMSGSYANAFVIGANAAADTVALQSYNGNEKIILLPANYYQDFAAHVGKDLLILFNQQGLCYKITTNYARYPNKWVLNVEPPTGLGSAENGRFDIFYGKNENVGWQRDTLSVNLASYDHPSLRILGQWHN